MKIALKYCGGCNSQYDRGSFFARLKAAVPEAIFAPADDTTAEMGLILAGCPVACARIQDFCGPYGVFVATGERDFDRLLSYISKPM